MYSAWNKAILESFPLLTMTQTIIDFMNSTRFVEVFDTAKLLIGILIPDRLKTTMVESW